MTDSTPYFPFWAKDWITSEATRLMSLAARGAYADLLAISWLASDEPCSLPNDDRALATLLSVPLREWKAVADVVRRQFELTDSGRLRNARLYAIYEEVQAKREKQVQGGRKGAALKWKRDGSPTGLPDGLPTGSPNGIADGKPMTTKAKARTKEEEPSRAEGAGSREEPSRPPRQAPSWLEPIAAVWTAKKGAFPFGKAGKLLKPLRDAGKSSEEIAAQLGRYLDRLDDPKYASLARFAETYEDHGPRQLLLEGGIMAPELWRQVMGTPYPYAFS